MFRKLTDHLFFIEDTCSVYAICVDDKLLLIDCGTHLTPEEFPIDNCLVERILLTHFHRDQCSSVERFQAEGAGVVIPFAERRFFEETDLLKASYDTYDNYTSYYPGRGVLNDIRADQYAYDYESVMWRGIRFDVVPLPGHTFGSVGYQFEIDGKRVLACGDLMTRPGKIREYFWSQWQYMSFQGHVNHLESLQTISNLELDLILPGHGKPFSPTSAAFAELQGPMEELYELFHGHAFEYYRPEFRQLTSHVYEVVNAVARTYIVRDNAGHALFIDCGYTSNAPISANPHRFIDHLTPYLKTELDIETVEWFLPSHYHDDHLAGYPALKTRYGTKLASSPELKDILENPQNYDMPCLVPQGCAVDRVIERGEPFRWRGVDFFMEQHPGQTLYHHLIWFTADEKKFLCIGDNISGVSFRENRDYIHSFIPKNRTPVSSYRDMPKQILDHAPDFILTGHGGGVVFEKTKAERWQAWMKRWEALFTKIIDQAHPNIGMDPHWVEFYPYKVR
ncbi:MAG: MBL fold metallo-hydrolase, partial [Candidatus Poribacteria bacterium]|nr:MBL fold metallo-hydrolase [Candidatus Poribacteria bacterium]